MIFFTLGTEYYPFHRLVKVAEQAAARLGGEEVFVQIGNHPDPPGDCSWERFLSFAEFSERIQRARVVVSHAGAGTILTCCVHRRVPIVLTREFARGEHVDDHQSQLARRMSELGHIWLTDTPEETLEAILRYDREGGRLKARAADVPKLAQSLGRHIAGLERD